MNRYEENKYVVPSSVKEFSVKDDNFILYRVCILDFEFDRKKEEKKDGEEKQDRRESPFILF